jgi:hypothetical protein
MCQTAPRPGQIEDVVCAADPTQTYALYLPSGYTPAKRWPMIYFFDPGGRGGRPVELYKEIAEKYGFVIAGSNNSRNFSGDQSKSVTAIWKDTHQRFALDEQHTYTSGFSGGARVAGSMAFSCLPCSIAGVIAQGAGYPLGHSQASDKLLYFFAVGDEDFNWPEIIAVRREREGRGLPYRVRVFSGPHRWAPVTVVEDAVRWLRLKGMQAGDLPRNQDFIDRLFRETQGEADDSGKKNDLIAQVNAYRSLVSDFAGLKDVSELEKRLTTLKESRALKAALKSEQAQIDEQMALQNEISPKLHAYVNGTGEDLTALRSEVLQAMRSLKDQATHSKDEGKRLIASRAFGGIWVEGIETGQRELESRHFDKAEAYFEVMSQAGDEPWPALLLAETHASAGKKKQAVKDLQEAVRRGLKDADVLESDDKLQILKAEVEFQKLVESLKHK